MAELELKAQIAEADKAVREAEKAIERAKAGGIDTTELEVLLAEQKAALIKLKTAYA